MIPWGRDTRLTVKENRTYEISLLTGDERWRISPLMDENGLCLRFTFLYPGIYSIDKVANIAVNIDRQMSTVHPLKEGMGKTSLKKWFFLICLFLVFIEMSIRNIKP